MFVKVFQIKMIYKSIQVRYITIILIYKTLCNTGIPLDNEFSFPSQFQLVSKLDKISNIFASHFYYQEILFSIQTFIGLNLILNGPVVFEMRTVIFPLEIA